MRRDVAKVPAPCRITAATEIRARRVCLFVGAGTLGPKQSKRT